MIIEQLAKTPSDLPTDASAFDSSISALKSCISALERSSETVGHSSGRWEAIAWVCAIVVAVGVALEIIGIVWQYRDDIRNWQRGPCEPSDRPSYGKLWFEIVATLLVVAGVVGEAGASLKLASINSQLRSITSELRGDSDQLLALVTQEAGGAKQSSIVAAGEATRAKGKADEAQAKAKAVGKEYGRVAAELAEQQERAANAEIAIANAHLAADKEREARLKLEEAISPRILEQAASAKTLGAFTGMRFAIKTVNGADLETRIFAGQIRVLLSMAHWTEDASLASLSIAKNTDEAVTVEYNSRLGVIERHTPAADSTDGEGVALLEIFQQNKIQSWMYPRGLSDTMPPLPGHTIIIDVGLKPIGTYFATERLQGAPEGVNGNKALGNYQER